MSERAFTPTSAPPTSTHDPDVATVRAAGTVSRALVAATSGWVSAREDPMKDHVSGAGRGIPDGMPVLRGGRHRRPEDGSCLMEYVSVLAGVRFSDRPRGTAPVLARLGRHANDRLRPEHVGGRRRRDVRRALLPLAPALAHTAPNRVVRPVVLDHLTAVGLAAAPGDRSLRRLRRRVLAYRLGVGGPVRRVWLRGRMVVATPGAFLRLRYRLQALPPKQRNAEWIGLLTHVVRDLADTTSTRTPVPVG